MHASFYSRRSRLILTSASIALAFTTSLCFELPARAESFAEQVKQAQALYDERKYDESIAKSTELLQKQSNNADLLLNRGICYYSTEKYQAALEDLLRARTLKPEEPITNYNLALVYNALEDYDKAIDAINLYLKTTNDADGIITRARSYRWSSEFQKALDDYTAAIKLKPDTIDAYLERSACYRQLKSPDKALEDCNKAIAIDPKSADAYYYRGSAYFDTKRYETAVEDYTRAILYKPDYADAYRDRAVLYEQLDQLQQALEDMNKALAITPDSADYRLIRGNLYFELGQYKEALSDYDKCLKLDPKNGDALLSRATMLGETGELERAIAELDKVLIVSPKNENATTNSAIVYLMLNKPDKALASANKGMTINPNLSSYYSIRAWAQAVLGNKTAVAQDLAEADRLAAKGGEEQKDDVMFGGTYAALAETISGQPERALVRINEVIKTAPRTNKSVQGWIHSIKAAILAQLGRGAEANAEMDAGVAADPESESARWMREKAKRFLATAGGGGSGQVSGSIASAGGGSGSASAEGVNRPVDDKWALIVGVGKFKDKSIPALKYATKDAKDFAQYLVDKGNFRKDHVRVLLDEQATRMRIFEEIGDKYLPRVASKNDLVVFYFSGHGSGANHDVGGENFLITHDANKNSLFASGIELQELTKVMKRRISSDRVLIVLDACHSGGADAHAKDLEPGSNFDINMLAGSGQLVICSSQQDQTSFESRRYNNGVFTKKLMESLAKNGATTKLKDAFEFLVDEVSREVQEDNAKKQTPVMKSQWNGNDLSVSIVPYKPRPIAPTIKELLEPDSFSDPAPAPAVQPAAPVKTGLQAQGKPTPKVKR